MDRDFHQWLDENPAATLQDAYQAGQEAAYKRGMDDGVLRDDAWIAPVENPYRAPRRLSWLFGSRR